MIREYVDLAKKRLDIRSDSKLADRIGISRSALSQILNGGTASQETLVKLARLCGEKPETLLANYELSRPHTPEVKSMWERIAGHAAIWFTTACGGLLLLPVAREIYILCKIELKSLLNS